jgi:TusA-related sulfurtransferase
MLKSKISYSFFSSFILRAPVYPIDFYKNLTNGRFIESDAIKEILKNTLINEALFLASPELQVEIQKWIKQKDYPVEKSNKIKLSVLKYLIRMSTRCTPFGLFAACGVGKLGNETILSIGKEKNFDRKTRFDTQFLANLATELTANLTVQNQLRFYTNTTLYQIGYYYRYVEYTLQQSKRKYSLEAFKYTDYLDLVLQKAVEGASKIELINVLVSDEITKNDAKSFIEELITSKSWFQIKTCTKYFKISPYLTLEELLRSP